MTTRRLEMSWKNRYGDCLVGMTTTSLYGSLSQYNSTRWHKCDSTEGDVSITPDDEF